MIRGVFTTARIPFGGNRNVCGNENKSQVQSTSRRAASRRRDVRSRLLSVRFYPERRRDLFANVDEVVDEENPKMKLSLRSRGYLLPDFNLPNRERKLR